MYLIASKRTDANAEMANASAEFALRVMTSVWGYKLYVGKSGWLCKCPEKLGSMELRKKFYQEYPEYIENYSLMPNELDAVAYIKNVLKADKEQVGYGLVTETLDNHYIPFDLIDTKSI